MLKWWRQNTAPAPMPAKMATKAVVMPSVGEVLHRRYRLDRQIGAGANATVYSARDVSLGRQVAVKVLKPDGLSAVGGEAMGLRAEALAALTLTHPHIVRVYHYEPGPPWEFLVMELVDGQDLAAVARQRQGRRLGPDEIRKVGNAVLTALIHAHQHGLIHNDIKPKNILLDEHGTPRVIDFGLASHSVDAEDSQLIAGTPAYLAPERVKGQPADARCDVYAVGATLFALAEGQPPYGRGREALDRPDDLAPPVASHLPTSVAMVLARALHRRPEARFASAEDMETAWRQAWRSADGRLPEVASVHTQLAHEPDEAFEDTAPLDPVEPVQPVAAARPAHPPKGMVRVGALYVDVVPVTQEDYARFVRDGGGRPPMSWPSGGPPAETRRHPVTEVDLADARAYAAWAGKRLPTEAEWRAFTLGEGRTFPWGNACNVDGCHCSNLRPRSTASVDAHPAGATPEGVRDLFGNVWEWTDPGSQHDGPVPVMGGSWRHPCRVDQTGDPPRAEVSASAEYGYLGFRCVADVEAP